MLLRNLFILVFLVSFFAPKAQQYSIETKAQFGVLLAHRPNIKQLLKGHTKAFTVNFEKTILNSSINNVYNAPSVGLSLYFADLGNPNQIGNVYGIYPYINTHFITREKIWWDNQVGFGFGWIEKPFDPIDNYQNLAAGSSFNLMVGLKTDFNFKLTKKIVLNTGFEFTHLSNGAIRLPNLGLNIPTISLGLVGKFTDEPRFKKDANPVKVGKPENTLFTYFQYGVREIEVGSGNLFSSYNLSTEFYFNRSKKFALSTGLDGFYKTYFDEVTRIDTSVTKTFSPIQLGVFGAAHQIFGPIDLYVSMGYYFVDDYKKNKAFYHRLGSKIKLSQRIYTNFNIYSHFAKADHFQIGLGYKFI
tara:strand:+ start:432 stop:1508 length:1077 start_codon:yes stop_codon:yes gene_type:complete